MNSGIPRERWQIAIVRAALFLAVFAAGAGLALADWEGSRRDGDYYWTIGSVVIARVVDVRRSAAPSADNPEASVAPPALSGLGLINRENSADNFGAIVARPVGAVSGVFDAGKTPQIIIDGLAIPDGVHNGDMILAEISDSTPAFGLPNPDAIYSTDQAVSPPLQYMPGAQAVLGISGFSDAAVEKTLEEIQKLRRKPDVISGDSPEYWQDRSVVVADAKKVGRAGFDATRYEFFVRGTLSGDYDAGKMPLLVVVLNREMQPTVLDERILGIGPRDTMLLLLKKGESDGEWHVPLERAAFMPYMHDPMVRISARRPVPHDKGVSEAIETTLGEIQRQRLGDTARAAAPKRAASQRLAFAGAEDRYWEAHGLIYAEVVGTKMSGNQAPQYTFTLRPKLTLSGRFDAGKTPKLSATFSADKPDSATKLSTVGPNVLVVLVKNGDAYSVSPERPAFMPGDHSSICTVKDFDDPKVKDTLEAVQKLRHASEGAGPKDEPAKH